MNLRNYQNEALDASLSEFKNGVNRQLIVMPTGTGKTCVFAALRCHHGFDKRVMVLVHRDELAQQAADKLQRWNPGERVGIEMADSVCSSDATFVVASVATIGRYNSSRLTKFYPDDFSAVVIDEAHHATADSYIRVVDYFNFKDFKERLLLGVTATPNRGDGAGLGKIFDKIVYQMSIPDAIAQGWLVDLRGLRVHTKLNLDDVHTVAGDFNQGELGDTVNTPERNNMIVKSWLKEAKDRPTIAFTVDIQHAKDLAVAFNNADINADAVWGDDPERSAKLQAFANGTLPVLANCNVLTEGWDCWRVGCIILARPTKSSLLFVQQIGRGTRLPDGISNMQEAAELVKRDCLVMDVVDNSSRHSVVTLPSIFGLGNLDIQGESITIAQKKIREAMEKAPGIDLEAVKSLTDLQYQVEQADLLTVKFAPEVTQNSELQWHRGPQGGFVLLLPNKDSVAIFQDLLGKCAIGALIKGMKYALYAENLPEAFAKADRLVQEKAPEYLRLLQREARWHNDQPSEAQLNLLRKFRIPYPANITKGVASHLISQFFARRYNRPELARNLR